MTGTFALLYSKLRKKGETKTREFSNFPTREFLREKPRPGAKPEAGFSRLFVPNELRFNERAPTSIELNRLKRPCSCQSCLR